MKLDKVGLDLFAFENVIYLVPPASDPVKEAMGCLPKKPSLSKQLFEERRKDFAEIKAEYPISYADCFALACAQEQAAALVTGDPDFKRVEHLVDIHWIR